MWCLIPLVYADVDEKSIKQHRAGKCSIQLDRIAGATTTRPLTISLLCSSRHCASLAVDPHDETVQSAWLQSEIIRVASTSRHSKP